MGFLYILSEDNNDDIFYRGCVEKILGRELEPIPQRSRKGGGISKVRSQIQFLMQQIGYSGQVEMGQVNCYLLEECGHYLLIDTGPR